MKNLFLSILLILSLSSLAQEEINQYDSNGRRHGEWKGYYEDDPSQLKYEGTFEHGREIGLFKFYQPGLKKPAATRVFSPDSDTVEVTFLTQKGKVISKGKMKGRERIGQWTYFHNNSDRLMMTENYKNGILNGEKIIYFDNGQVAEKASYTNGVLHGERILYSEKGVVLEHLNYEEGKLHGPAKFYNGKGELLTEGTYRDDQHHGLWKYYENGELKEEKTFPENRRS